MTTFNDDSERDNDSVYNNLMDLLGVCPEEYSKQSEYEVGELLTLEIKFCTRSLELELYKIDLKIELLRSEIEEETLKPVNPDGVVNFPIKPE